MFMPLYDRALQTSGVIALGLAVVTATPDQAHAFVVERVSLSGNPSPVQVIDSWLHLPVDVDVAPGIPDTYFVSQLGGVASDASDGDDITKREGRIVLMDPDTGIVDYANPFLVIGETTNIDLSTVPEVGLFSTVFHPDFQTNGKFYVSVAVDFDGPAPPLPAGDPRSPQFNVAIREYTADPNNLAAGATFSKTIIELVQPVFNHNGSWLGFNPMETAVGDNNLYITFGDGGDQNDPRNYGQDTSNLYGTVVRIDIDGDDFPADPDRNYAIPADNPFVGSAGLDEIFAYGFRNPWRASFDSATGDLYIGDVGQFTWEEINFMPNGIGPTDDRNFGWRLREGFVTTPSGGVGGPQPADGVDPIIAYMHGGGTYNGNSVVGGIVYRGPIPELYGKYIFADSVSGNIWGIDLDDIPNFDPSNPGATLLNLTAAFAPEEGSFTAIVSFAEDEDGNLLIVDNGYNLANLGGHIFRVMPDAVTIPGDLDGDGFVGIADLNIILGMWNNTVQDNHPADPSGDNFVGIADLNVVLGNWNAGTPPTTEANIPEPSSILLTLGATLIHCRRPRR